MAAYHRPLELGLALDLLAREHCRPLAGGTDFYPAAASAYAWGEPSLAYTDASRPATLDLSALDELRGIRVGSDDASIEIGALVTWTDAIEADHARLPAWFTGLRLAGREVGGVQIQNRGTLVGNLCNASPAADGVPPLLTLDAKVRLLSKRRGQRELALGEFILGNRRTARRADELVSAIVIPKPVQAARVRSTFLKLGARRYLVIAIAMVAVTLASDEADIITAAAVAVGACSAVAQRLPALEQRLLGQPLAQAERQVRTDDFAALTPIDDVRATASYRRHAAQVLVGRALRQLAGESDLAERAA